MISLETPPSRRAYFLLRSVFQLVAWCLTKLKVAGLENIPEAGPFLLVINHLSIADPIIAYITSPRQMIMFSADKWRNTPVVSHIANTAGVIWVARGEVDRSALKRAIEFLKAGWGLGVAPEGTRSRAGTMQPGKAGAAYLADRARVPVLPVALMGTEKLGHNLKRLRRTPIKCIYGKPFLLPSNGRARADELDALTDLIMCHIAALLAPPYRGVYADHPKLQELLQAQADLKTS